MRSYSTDKSHMKTKRVFTYDLFDEALQRNPAMHLELIVEKIDGNWKLFWTPYVQVNFVHKHANL